MIDEAFLPFQQLVEQMLSFSGGITNPKAGVHCHIYECAIESPVELDIVRDHQGRLQIGSVPPLYRVDTSFRPVFHQLRFTAMLSKVPHAE